MTKSEMRKIILEQRKTMTENELKTQSAAIAKRLIESDYYKECSTILTYVSFHPEVDTIDIIEDAWNEGKSVYVPKVVGKELIFYEIHDFVSLTRSKFGILEPIEGVHLEYVSKASDKVGKLMLLPGLAFDSSGNRIGYGAGYYDRFLFQHIEDGFTKIALAYSFQLQNQIPTDENDIKTDFIITPNKVYDCR